MWLILTLSDCCSGGEDRRESEGCNLRESERYPDRHARLHHPRRDPRRNRPTRPRQDHVRPPYDARQHRLHDTSSWCEGRVDGSDIVVRGTSRREWHRGARGE